MGEYNPPINVTLISAQGIKNLNWFRKMDVYTEAWIEGLEENKKSTNVAKKCGTNPKWDYNRMTFTYAELYPGGRSPDPNLVVQLMAKRTTTDKIIGSVTIPILSDLFYGKNEERSVQYKVCMESGKAKGLLQLSCNFGSERPQTKAEANEPLPEYQKTYDHRMSENSDTSYEHLQTNLTVYKPETIAQSNESLPEIHKPYKSEFRKMHNHRMLGDGNASKKDSLCSAAIIVSTIIG